MQSTKVDIVILGGGIHGLAVAREAGCRGLSCILIEHQDLASSGRPCLQINTTGDLRNLERLALYSMRRNAKAQSTLQHFARPFTREISYFVVPGSVRSQHKIRWGTQLLQILSGQRKRDHTQSQGSTPQSAVIPALISDHQFTDIVANEVRVSIATAHQAQQLGAELHNYSEIIQCERTSNAWNITANNTRMNSQSHYSCDVLMNCTGSAATNVLETLLRTHSRCRSTSITYSYAVVKKQYPGDHGYVLQADDGQLIYVTPIDNEHLQLGPLKSDAQTSNSMSEQALIALYNRDFAQPLSKDNIVRFFHIDKASYEDPCENGKVVLLDSLVDLNVGQGKAQAPLLTLFGNQFTQHRLYASKALDILKPFTRKAVPRCADLTPLPGCEQPSFTRLKQTVLERYPGIDSELLERFARSYGGQLFAILGASKTMGDLGQHFGSGIFQVEIDYALHHEWVTCADDFLMRRLQTTTPTPHTTKLQIDNYIQSVQ